MKALGEDAGEPFYKKTADPYSALSEVRLRIDWAPTAT